MKTLLINGSPRSNGNTVTALKALTEGMKERDPGGEIRQIDAARINMTGCTHCNTCKENGGVCAIKDDGEEIMTKLCEADRIVFATPVYWWGVTAQLKTVVDRMFAKIEPLMKEGKKKEIGLIAIGQADVTGEQYELISRQFRCICGFLGWELVIDEAICAAAPDDLASDKAKLEHLKQLMW